MPLSFMLFVLVILYHVLLFQPGLVQWLKANFGEAFSQWMHIKVCVVVCALCVRACVRASILFVHNKVLSWTDLSVSQLFGLLVRFDLILSRH
jgi:NAD-dependent dihydropyrimidine dehydrogenase PreA subunit